MLNNGISSALHFAKAGGNLAAHVTCLPKDDNAPGGASASSQFGPQEADFVVILAHDLCMATHFSRASDHPGQCRKTSLQALADVAGVGTRHGWKCQDEAGNSRAHYQNRSPLEVIRPAIIGVSG